MKILTILGARPQFIKAGVVSREIRRVRKEGKNVHEVVVHTGQHYDENMSNVFFKELNLPEPDYNLGICDKSHGAMTGEMMIKLEEVMKVEKPDIVLVYGDTNSTLAGALTASKLHIPVAHVEAGLRSFNMNMPEEINRILTDRVSKWLFCPTDTAVKNLEAEGFRNFDCKVVKSGDVMYDASLYYRKFAKKPNIEINNDVILCTIHRAENTDDPQRLSSIFEALREISKFKEVVLPIHPRTKKRIREFSIDTTGIKIIEPVSYLENMWLLENCEMVITDSGGLQKEAFFFKKPCIILREETEWIELVENGYSVLAGTDVHMILKSLNFNFTTDYVNNPYGSGNAGILIIESLV